MGREKDPFQKRRHSQDGRRRGKYEEEYNLYEDEFESEEYDEDEFERENDFDEEGSNVSRHRPGSPLPPFPSRNKNVYPRRPRIRHTPEAATPRPPIRSTTHVTRSKRHAYRSDEPQPPGRHSTGSYQRSAQRRTRTRSDLPPSRPASARRVPERPRKRSVWPIFLGGCAAGAVSLVLALAILVWLGIHSVSNDLMSQPGGKPVPGESSTQTVALSALSQLIVCDSAGNISVDVDPNANTSNAVVTTTKIVQTSDQDVANKTFSQIAVSVAAQPPGSQPLTCQDLAANPSSSVNTAPTTTATPTASNKSVLSVNVGFALDPTSPTATVDVAITLPRLVVQSQDPAHSFTSTLISMPNAQGTINIDGVSGKMLIHDSSADVTVKNGTLVHDSSGDVTVKNGTLLDGSRLQAEGKVTFNGSVGSTPGVNLFFESASLIDLTLPATSSVMIDATANVRNAKITSDFPISVNTNPNDGSLSYYGPFNPAMPPTDKDTAPLLTLLASSGNIAIHGAKTS